MPFYRWPFVVLLAVSGGDGLRLLDGLLGADGEFVEVHGRTGIKPCLGSGYFTIVLLGPRVGRTLVRSCSGSINPRSVADGNRFLSGEVCWQCQNGRASPCVSEGMADVISLTGPSKQEGDERSRTLDAPFEVPDDPRRMCLLHVRNFRSRSCACSWRSMSQQVGLSGPQLAEQRMGGASLGAGGGPCCGVSRASSSFLWAYSLGAARKEVRPTFML